MKRKLNLTCILSLTTLLLSGDAFARNLPALPSFPQEPAPQPIINNQPPLFKPMPVAQTNVIKKIEIEEPEQIAVQPQPEPKKASKPAKTRKVYSAKAIDAQQQVYLDEYVALLYDAIYTQDENAKAALMGQLGGIDAKNSRGDNVLLMSATLGNTMIAQEALHLGADPNSKNAADQTPLHLSTFYKYHEIIQILLDSGANPNVTYAEGLSPIMLAVMNNDVTSVQILTQKGAKYKKRYNGSHLTHYAAVYGDTALMDYLLSLQGLSVSNKNSKKQTPIMVAAAANRTPMVLHLLNRGANFSEIEMAAKNSTSPELRDLYRQIETQRYVNNLQQQNNYQAAPMGNFAPIATPQSGYTYAQNRDGSRVERLINQTPELKQKLQHGEYKIVELGSKAQEKPALQHNFKRIPKPKPKPKELIEQQQIKNEKPTKQNDKPKSVTPPVIYEDAQPEVNQMPMFMQQNEPEAIKPAPLPFVEPTKPMPELPKPVEPELPKLPELDDPATEVQIPQPVLLEPTAPAIPKLPPIVPANDIPKATRPVAPLVPEFTAPRPPAPLPEFEAPESKLPVLLPKRRDENTKPSIPLPIETGEPSFEMPRMPSAPTAPRPELPKLPEPTGGASTPSLPDLPKLPSPPQPQGSDPMEQEHEELLDKLLLEM